METKTGRRLRLAILLVSCLVFLAAESISAAPHEVTIDLSKTNGVIRPLHGINKGPLAPGGLIDLTGELKQLKIPSIRLHDCHWPNPDVVDIHSIFPNFDADPTKPSSYEFGPTDEYLQACLNTGAQIVYRLGESIEHTTIKRFVHPPRDVVQWTEICLGIIRHYNEGWANGFRHGINYWEIWNEPENRPAMWTGNDDQFLELYGTAATRIKKQFPHLKVGGPAFGHSGEYKEGKFTPSPFVLRFLQMCRDEKVPLDFFSWHCYTDDPAELTAKAKAIRKLLNEHGFGSTESHLNEWNFLPQNSWAGLSRKATATERQLFYDQMSGPAGGAFVAASLIEFQDAPIDTGNFFHGELGGFGLFNENGVPSLVYHTFDLFGSVLSSSHRLQVDYPNSKSTKCDFLAGMNPESGNFKCLIVNRGPEQEIIVALTGWSAGKKETFNLLKVTKAGKTEQKLLPTELREQIIKLRFQLKENEIVLLQQN